MSTETALGVQLDECLNGDEYRENIEKVELSLMRRCQNPFYMSDTLYKYLGNGREDEKYLQKLHAFSSGIIEKRRKQFEQQNLEAIASKHEQAEYVNTIITSSSSMSAALMPVVHK